MIFNIQCYFIYDGFGICIVVFFKGCLLGCCWCQNLESCVCVQDLLYDVWLCFEGCDLCV